MTHRIVLLLTSVIGFAAGKEQPGERLPLWPDAAPLEEHREGASMAYYTLHHPATPNGTAVIICPGGGYGRLVTGGEGHGIAKWLNQHGITGIVLEYRLPRGRATVPLMDAQRAIRLARKEATNWNCDPSRIGIIGFSAGGHLASTAATHFDRDASDGKDPLSRISCRPDFAILIYPVISMGNQGHGGSTGNLLGPDPSSDLLTRYSNDLQVTAKTPPTFLAHAVDDKVVPPENSERFHEALKQQGVPTRYLELPSGGHGLNGYKGPNWDAWQKGSLEWLRELGFLEVAAD